MRRACSTSRPVLSFTFNLPLWLPAVCFTLLTGAVIRGGIQSIGRTAERLVPAAAAIYVLFSLTVILSSLPVLPGVLKDIFDSAFHIRAAAGGAGGFLISRSVRYGIARGVFSNEAGLGTLAVLHGPAEHTTPEKQGMWAMFEVFFDTVISDDSQSIYSFRGANIDNILNYQRQFHA